MRVLIVAAVLACAAAAPSGLLAPYSHGLVGHAGLAYAHAAPLAVAHAAPVAVAHAPVLPTISPGDIAGAAIDAHVEANDHVRAAVDQASELQGRAINAVEDHSWQAVSAVQTAQAQLDGAAAGVAPVVAKQIVGHAPVVAAAPLVAAAPVAAYGAHGVVAAPAVAAYAAPAYAASQTVVRSSLSQTHPAPLVHAAHLAVAHAAPLAVAHAAPVAYAHGLGAHAW